MLVSLRFQNITLFGTLEIDFDKGFTAFTGETGSGKSIFIDTLNAFLVNQKTPLNNRLVKKGSSFSSIEESMKLKDFLNFTFVMFDRILSSVSSIILIVLVMSPAIPDARVEMVTALLSTYVVANLGIVATFMGTTAFTRSKENGK